MRILYSHRTQSADGQYVHIRALCDALAARGHDIFICGPAGGGRDDALSAASGGSMRKFLPGPLYEWAEYGYSWRGAERLLTAARSAPPDVLYERYNLFYHAGARVKRALGVPLILEVNAPLVDERSRNGELTFAPLARRSEQSIWRAADMVLPVSNVLADHVRAAGVGDERIEVVHNGVDADFLKRHDGSEVRTRYGLQDKLVLGFSGFVRDWHGVDQAIHFLAQSERRDLNLLLVGDGPARTDLETLAKRLGVADRFFVTGVVQRDAMAGHVAAFDIALQPAVTPYASPLKIFEYMAQEMAIVAPRARNILEILRHGEDGFLFDEGDEASFARALQCLIDDADLRKRLGAAARDTLIRKDYTWAGNAARVEKIALRLLEETP